jgi:hypothetical protein
MDPDQFNNGVIGADGCFCVVRRNEIFVIAEDEESHTRAAHSCDHRILRRREIGTLPRGSKAYIARVEDVAAIGDRREVDRHASLRVDDFGEANARGASGRSGFRTRADNEVGRGTGTERHFISEAATGCLSSPEGAQPDSDKIVGPGAQARLRTGSAQDDKIIVTVANRNDAVLCVVLDEIADVRATL